VFDVFWHVLIDNVIYFEYLLSVHVCHVLQLLTSLGAVKQHFALGLFQQRGQ